MSPAVQTKPGRAELTIFYYSTKRRLNKAAAGAAVALMLLSPLGLSLGLASPALAEAESSMVSGARAVLGSPERTALDSSASPQALSPSPTAEAKGAEPSGAPGAADLEPPLQESFEELLERRQGREFQHDGQSFVWRDGQSFLKDEQGRLQPVEAPPQLFELGEDGRPWLSRQADGTIYIDVAPRVWASINFELDSDKIKEESKPVLDIFGTSLKGPALAKHRLLIVGHSSAEGRSDYNLRLSRRRASSVAAYLSQAHDLAPERFILHGYGDQRPIADNDSEEGRSANRRVEFILLSPE